MSSTDQSRQTDQVLFDAYVNLRRIAQKYGLEEQLSIPRVVFVGETSSGKSMLVQNFLRFPCAFSYSDVGTRCPILYRLRYNPELSDDDIIVKHPKGIRQPQDLANHLRQVMEDIERKDGFQTQEYVIHIESSKYRDFEILDVPGLIGGSWDSEHATAVERITERYVRDPTFLIVQLKEAAQLGVNSFATKRIREFCCSDPAPRGSSLPPRHDYESYTLTIQTKFDIFMDGHKDISQTYEDMQKLHEHFKEQTLFVSMIFDAYNFGKHSYEENAKYIAKLPELEAKRVDDWIRTLKTTPGQSKDFCNPSDIDQFRSLIGISRTRDRIQDLWIQAFRGAIPKIQHVLQQLVHEQRLKYQALNSMVQEFDLKSIRQLYKKYIRAFRSMLSNYVSFRAETSSRFDLEKYGRTYPQIEEEYNRWPRKTPISWWAYQTAEQMSKAPSGQRVDTLPLKYIGARHCERLRQVFFHIILTYQPTERDRDWMESAQGLLYGGVADDDNILKSLRELLFTNIRESFLMGTCWLTQMYSFLLDHFEQQVTEVLVGPNSDFAVLAKKHEKFLSYVRLEYHQVTRKMIRRAVEASKHLRHSKMVYVAHNLCAYLRTLVESFPPTIKDGSTKESPKSDTSVRQLIYADSSALPSGRSSASANHLAPTYNKNDQIYAAIRGLLLHDITTSFYANVVVEIANYEKVEIEDPLEFRLDHMSDAKVASLSRINIAECLQELQEVHEKLMVLEDACSNIERSIVLFNNPDLVHNTTASENKRNQYSRDRLLQRHHELVDKVSKVKPKELQAQMSKDTNDDIGSDLDDDEHQLRIVENSPQACEQYLLELFRKHDYEDLKHNFLQYDHFPTQIIKPTAKRSPGRPAAMNQSAPPPSTTNTITAQATSASTPNSSQGLIRDNGF